MTTDTTGARDDLELVVTTRFTGRVGRGRVVTTVHRSDCRTLRSRTRTLPFDGYHRVHQYGCRICKPFSAADAST